MPVQLRAACLREVAFEVNEDTLMAAMACCARGVDMVRRGDVEGGLAALRGPDAPPLAWKHHPGVGRETWAAFSLVLGTAYCERIVGRRAANLEEAKRSFEGTLEVYTMAEFPGPWAETNNYLATVHGELGELAAATQEAAQHEDGAGGGAGGGGAARAVHLARAVEHYALALQVGTPPLPSRLVLTHRNRQRRARQAGPAPPCHYAAALPPRRRRRPATW